MMRFKHVLLGLLFTTGAAADTIILKDGTFIDGTILLETSKSVRVESVYGVRSYKRSDIDRIIETVDYADPESVNRFEQMPAALRAALNATADYKLANYDRALERLQPFLEAADNPAVKNTIDWLVIEINERLGHWETAKRLLEDKKKDGNPREKLRAKAHLDILGWNPDYDLRYIGRKHARQFLIIADEELRNRAREPNSLMHPEIMNAALREYCEQLLQKEEFSVPALEGSFRPRRTYEACLKLPPAGDIERFLPYADRLKRAEQSISKAQAVLPGYGSIYEVQIMRVETSHLRQIWRRLINETLQVIPRLLAPAFNPETGRLTRDGREQLVEQCDEFIMRANKVLRVIEYIQEKTLRYPRKFDTFIERHETTTEYLDNLIKWAKRLKRKTHV